ncbi:hypothetical protein PV772_18615 [Pseudarthrobacter sp. CC12]|uniref:HEPN domain-containing protein n=1 Tax=Pseudarthrobacter sp. CC12 TaxID=3029193 RepID=UPI0032644878
MKNLDKALLGSVTTQFPAPLTAAEQALTHGYLVLAHAVLEEHLEKIFEEHFDRLVSWLVSDLVPRETALLAYAVKEWLPASLNIGYKQRDLHQFFAKPARNEFIKLLGKNNGLKLENVAALAKLVGLDWKSFEDALNAELSDLTTLGSKRGAAGHLSPYTSKVTELTENDYPEDVRTWVDAGERAIERIRLYLSEILLKQQPPSLISDWDGN